VLTSPKWFKRKKANQICAKADEKEAKSEEKKPAAEEKKQEKKLGGALMKEEERSFGSVKWAIYRAYIDFCGGNGIVIGIMILYTVSMGSSLYTNVWLAEWSGRDKPDNGYYLGVYAALGMSYVFITFIGTIITSLAGMSAARKMHNMLLESMMRAPMAFYDTTPIGRVLNRFSKDLYTIDERLSGVMSSYFRQLFSFLGVLIIISVVTPFFLLALLPLGVLYYYVQEYYSTVLVNYKD